MKVYKVTVKDKKNNGYSQSKFLQKKQKIFAYGHDSYFVYWDLKKPYDKDGIRSNSLLQEISKEDINNWAQNHYISNVTVIEATKEETEYYYSQVKRYKQWKKLKKLMER